jgi:formylglycine-generating enzyme required for sulfatase activity
MAVSAAWAEPLSIIGFETGTGLAFEGATVSNYYTLEFAPTVAGPWTNWGSVCGQAITGTVMTLPTPFFYRIRQTDSSAFPPYAPVANIPGSMLADGAITPAKLADGAVNLGGPAITGTIPDARLSTNVPLLNGHNIFTGEIYFGSGGVLYGGQGGSIELGDSLVVGAIPFIDFHYGTGSAEDFNVRLINDASNRLTLAGDFGVNGKVGIGTVAPAEKLDVAGAVKLGTTTNPAPAAGTIRWTGTDFQGFNGGQWISLAAPGSASGDMVLVPGGTFTMGSAAVDSGDPQYNPVPEHQVTLSSFYLAKCEVTYAMWYAIRQWAIGIGYSFQNAGREGNNGTIGAAPTTDSGEPVTYISWRDAIVWCNARSLKDGLVPVYTYGGNVISESVDANSNACDNAVFNTGNNGYRLPTEAEYEYAARYVDGWSWTPGDYPSGAGFNYSNAVSSEAVSWYYNNSSNKTHVAGTKKPNQLGIFDMSGNAMTWCWDWWETYSSDAVTNPVGPASGIWRTERGAAFGFDRIGLPCAMRGAIYSNHRQDYKGMRCARNAH